MIRRFIPALLLLANPLGASETAPLHPLPDFLRVEDRRIVDDQGRTVILRGVNVNQLGDYFQGNPDVPATIPLERSDMERIAALGMDVVRLLVHWSRLEPEPGVHDTDYLAEIKEAVAWAKAMGIHIVLDMHQDAWGKHIASDPDEPCRASFMDPAIGWDGAPEWATLTKGMPRCRLDLRELSPAVMTAAEAFWQNEEGIQDHLVDTWAWLAAEFKDDPTVVGYDLLNEPHWGIRYFRNLAVRKPRFYRDATAAIRTAEDGGHPKIVFYEPFVLWSAFAFEPVVPWLSDSQVVFAPHNYLGSISADMDLFGREIIPIWFGFWEAQREARRRNTTFWFGEWGWFGGESDYMERFAALEDLFQVGSAFWQWKQACGDPHGVSWPEGDVPSGSGNLVRLRCKDPEEPAGVDLGLREDHALVLSRPYPRRFPGEATWETDPFTATIWMQGTSDLPAPPAQVWIPGMANPLVETTGIRVSHAAQVPGGWILDLEPTDRTWEFEIQGEPYSAP